MTPKTKRLTGLALFAAGFLATQAYLIATTGWLSTLLCLAVASALVGGYVLMGER